MERPGTYCEGEREMLAACRALNVNLHVYGTTPQDDRTFVGPPSATGFQYIVHYNYGDARDHFMGVERLSSATVMNTMYSVPY